MGFKDALEICELKCPCCGYVIGEQAVFQKYELNTAAWLRGRVAAIGNKAFDVWKCEPFPTLTFQVKHANVYHFSGTAKRHMTKVWAFNQSTMPDDCPDYFVLFGIDDEGEHCFLLSRQDFIKHASPNGKNGYIMQVSPNRIVRRGSYWKGYTHLPFIWEHEVRDPERNLISSVKAYEERRNESVDDFMARSFGLK